MDKEPTSVGFVGLGIMGFPMAKNLISKLPPGSKIFIYDVFEDAINRFKALFPDAAVPCSSAREVTENSVSPSISVAARRRQTMPDHPSRKPSSPWSQRAHTSAPPS